jgi:hypothetical protein
MLVVCIASGPSLTQEQVNSIPDGTTVICVNDNYRLYPKCQHVFAADSKWWRRYYDDVIATVSPACRLHTTYKATPRWERVEGWHTHKTPSKIGYSMFHGGNSGLLAVELARVLGATKIVLLGYDCRIKDKSHWFGDHPEGFRNADGVDEWIVAFDQLDKAYKELGIDLVNCSLDTALTIRRSTLEKELENSMCI